jgi:hypothetical protein
VGADPRAEVFTLVPPDERPDGRVRFADLSPGRLPRDRERGGPPPSGRPAPALMVFRRSPDGRVTVDGFPDEIDVCEPLVARLNQAVVRLERGRLYVEAANGRAVYVPIGPSPRPDCQRYARLYLHREGR